MTLAGLDVSSYQSTTPPLTGKSFLFARATYGTWHDPDYAMHIANARKAGLVTGAYHFGRSGSIEPIADQVREFLLAAQDADLLALDLEGDGGHVGMTNAEAGAFIAAVQKTRPIGLYHSLSGYPSVGQDFNWVAFWGTTPPSITWTFWQYQGSPLDLDRFNGDLAALRLLANPISAGPIQGEDVNAATQIPIALADVGAATLYADENRTTVVWQAWPGAKNVGVYSRPNPATLPDGKSALAAIRISGTGGANPQVAYVGDNELSNVRLTTALPDCTAAVKAATDPLAASLATANTLITSQKAQLDAANGRIKRAVTDLGGTIA